MHLSESVCLCIPPVASVSGKIINKCQCASSFGHKEPPTCLTDEVVFWVTSCSFFSSTLCSFHHFARRWFLIHQSIELCSRLPPVSFSFKIFFTMQMIFRSSTGLVLLGLPGHLVLSYASSCLLLSLLLLFQASVLSSSLAWSHLYSSHKQPHLNLNSNAQSPLSSVWDFLCMN